MRVFPYPTIGKLLEELHKDGLPISRPTFYKLEREGVIPTMQRTSGNWRKLSPDDVVEIKVAIWANYRGAIDAAQYRKKLHDQTN